MYNILRKFAIFNFNIKILILDYEIVLENKFDLIIVSLCCPLEFNPKLKAYLLTKRRVRTSAGSNDHHQTSARVYPHDRFPSNKAILLIFSIG